MAESVAWITERKNVLSMALLLAAALCWLRGGRVSSFVFFLAALLSKVSAFFLPPALLLIVWWQHRQIRWRRDVLPLVPHFIAALVLGLLVMRLETHVVGAKGADFDATLFERLFIAGHAPWFYASKLLWPLDLCSVYPVRWQSWLPPIFTLIVPVVLFVRRARWGRGPLAGVLYFLIALLPVLGFFNVYGMLFSPVADRWAYTASLAVFAGLAALPKDFRWVLFALTPILIFLTRERARLHESQKTYWQAVLTQNPESWLARHGFGFALAQEGDMKAAITNFRLCLERRRQYAKGWMNLGNAYHASGDPREALKHLQHAVDLEPGLPGAHYNLGNCHLHLGEVPQAIAAYEKEIALGGVRDAGNNLAALLLQIGRAKEAAQRFEEVLRAHPDHPAALANYAWLLATQPDDTLRDGPRAIELARRAGGDAQALRSLAAALAETGHFEEALEVLARAKAKSQSAAFTEEERSYQQRQPFRQK
jgi:tetratricopeptide (TPR) repeat protein